MVAPKYTENSVILITGASSGLGAACAFHFAGGGNRLVLVARRKSKLEATAHSVRRNKGMALTIPADLREPEDIDRICQRIDEVFGCCDVLINNAGIYLQGTSLADSELRAWNDMMNTNTRAPYLLSRGLVPGMIERRRGRVVNVISASATLKRMGLFRISKVALEVMTAVLAAELRGTGVAAVAVNPGFMRTEICTGGRDPTVVAEGLELLLNKPTGTLNGAVFDAESSGAECRFHLRPSGVGRFGLI